MRGAAELALPVSARRTPPSTSPADLPKGGRFDLPLPSESLLLPDKFQKVHSTTLNLLENFNCQGELRPIAGALPHSREEPDSTLSQRSVVQG